MTFGPWQATHPLVMPLWLNWAPANVVPDEAPEAGTRLLGVPWHVEHAAVVGKCGGFSAAVVLSVVPKKALLDTDAPWQVSQPDVMPEWLNCPPAKVD